MHDRIGKYAFTVVWEKGRFNDNIVKFLKANNIDFHYNHFFQLVADVCGNGKYSTFDYKKISGDIFGVILKEAVA